MDRRTTRFEALYREHFGFVWAAARGLGAPESGLPDVVQEVFVTAYRRLSTIDADRSPRGWLYAVTRRVIFRVRRTAARATRRELAMRGASDAGGVEPTGDEVVDLARLLDALEPSQREVLVMADLLGMSGPEMAAQTGAPLDTVYSRLRLARGRLQRMAREEVALTLEAARRAPEDARARCWLALAPTLSPSAVAATGALGLAKLSLGVAAAVGGIAWWLASPRPALPSTREAAAVEVAATDEPHRVATSPTASNLSPPLGATQPAAPQPAAPQPAVLQPAALHPVALQPAGPQLVRPADGASARTVGAAGRAVPELAGGASTSGASHDVEGIDAELAALEAARARLDAGDPAGALTSLRATGGSDPAGQLADVRGALAVRALCELGRRTEAARDADALRRRFPGSHAAASARCDAP
jgi:RNA polymerase sigma factor (sigma-70 family)